MKNRGGGHQYAPTTLCDSPYGKDTSYCDPPDRSVRRYPCIISRYCWANCI